MFQKNIPEVLDGVDSCGGGGGDERGLQGGHPAGGGVSREKQVSTDKPKVSEAVVSDWTKKISRICEYVEIPAKCREDPVEVCRTVPDTLCRTQPRTKCRDKRPRTACDRTDN